MRLTSFLLTALVAVMLMACGSEESSTTSSGGDRSTLEQPSDPPASGFRETAGIGITSFGIEADDAERARAQAGLVAYMRAYRAEDWDQACSRFDANAAAQLRTLLARAKGVEDVSCAEALRLFSASPEQPRPYRGAVEIAALRIKRGAEAGAGAGFALFHGDDGKDYWITMRREGESWKVTALAPQELR